MKQEILQFEMVTGIEEMKDAMFATMNITSPKELKYAKGVDKTVHRMLLNLHSPCNAVIFKVKACVLDRTHTHLRTHHGMSNIYFCGSSRKDLSHGEVLEENGEQYRIISFMVDMKRLVEIGGRRLCLSASKETRTFWEDVVSRAIDHVPELETHAVKPCVTRGFCVEGMTDCGFSKSDKYYEQRRVQERLAYSLLRSSPAVFWSEWKRVYGNGTA